MGLAVIVAGAKNMANPEIKLHPKSLLAGLGFIVRDLKQIADLNFKVTAHLFEGVEI